MTLPIQVSMTVAETVAQYSLSVQSNATAITLAPAETINVEILGYPEYEGLTTIIPGEEAQTLSTAQRTLLTDIVINPIPSNYGKITYNGTSLTVS